MSLHRAYHVMLRVCGIGSGLTHIAVSVITYGAMPLLATVTGVLIGTAAIAFAVTAVDPDA